MSSVNIHGAFTLDLTSVSTTGLVLLRDKVALELERRAGEDHAPTADEVKLAHENLIRAVMVYRNRTGSPLPAAKEAIFKAIGKSR